MRKQILFGIVFFTSISISVAQAPVLTAADFGTNVSANIHRTYGGNFPNGYDQTGSDYVWDFSSMAIGNIESKIISVPVDYVTNIDDFPTAMYCERKQYTNGGNYTYELFTVTPDAYKLIAQSFLSTNATLLGATNQDLYYLNTMQMMGGYQPLYNIGYGTLITPFETFTNVVKFGRTYYDPFGGQTTTRLRWIATNPYRNIMEVVYGGGFYYSFYEYVPYSLGLNMTQESNFAIYPNPTQGNFTIHNESDFNAETFVSVYDILGKVFISNEKINEDFKNISLRDFSPGLYIVKITNKENHVLYTEKIIRN